MTSADSVDVVSGARQDLSYRPALDGIRALAVAGVVAYHFGWQSMRGGFLGVDVFFALSGYLITSLLLAEHARDGSISMSRFYARRVRRLFPALALVLLAVSVDLARHGSPIRLAERFHDVIAVLCYYANFHFIATDQSYFVEDAGVSPLRHAWSLSIEEQFYVCWPLLLLLLLRVLGMRRRRQLVMLLSLLALASAAAMAVVYDPAAPSRAYYGTDARVQQLLVGAVLAVVLHGHHRDVHAVRSWVPGAAGVAGLLSLLYLMHRLHDSSAKYYHGGAFVAAVLATVLIAAVELAPRSGVASGLSARPLVWVGKLSYGIYLWHWPVLLWVDGTLARVAVTLFAAALSYYVVERPLRTGQLAWVARTPRRTAVAFAVAFSVVAGTAYAGTRPPSLAEDTIAAEARTRAFTPCKVISQPCIRRSGGPGAPVIASIGDSTMEGYDDALRRIAADQDVTYVQAAVPGCPLSLRPIRSGPAGSQTVRDRLCEAFAPRAYEELVSRWNVRVFVGTAVREFLPTEDPDGHVVKSMTPAHLRLVRAGLERAVGVLTRRGAVVVLVHILPRGPADECLSVRTSRQRRCTTTVAADRHATAYNALFDQVAARHPANVKVIDVTDLLCPGGRCPVTAHGITLRGDPLHLTTVASEWITPYLYARLRRVGITLH